MPLNRLLALALLLFAMLRHLLKKAVQNLQGPVYLGTGLVVALLIGTTFGNAKSPPPNFIIIFTDDQGYQDIGCYGSPDIRTPNLDRMAAEGMRFTDFYAQTVCGPSRSSLMTGCYPLRVGREDNLNAPHPRMDLSEITIAEILKDQGYATAMYGKWDLAGHTQRNYTPGLLPKFQGFDESFFTPSSNDSIVNLVRGDEMIEEKADMAYLTQRYTAAALDFIERKRDEPFFVYLAHTMPHTILDASPPFKGKSKRGLYGDVIEEIDYNVGRVLDKVKDLGIDENTYIFYMSDNGPWWLRGEHGGSALPLRGAKTSSWEGGFRVPCIMRAPGKIPAGTTCEQVTATLDILPTIAAIAGTEAPQDRVIDGLDIADIIHGSARELDRPYYYYQHTLLEAVRYDKWKLFIPATNDLRERWFSHIAPEDRRVFAQPSLYNLETDLGEQHNVAAENPEVVAQLMERIDWAIRDIGNGEFRGVNARPINTAQKQ